MKKLTILLALFIVGFSVQAQKPVKEKNLLGEWKLIIDVDEDEIMDEIEEDEDIPFFGEWIAETVIGLAFNIIDDLDIYFTFKEDGKLKVVVEIFGEREVEYSEWYINKDGELVLGETDAFDSDDDIWLMEGDRLVAYEEDWKGRREREREVYMIKVD